MILVAYLVYFTSISMLKLFSSFLLCFCAAQLFFIFQHFRLLPGPRAALLISFSLFIIIFQYFFTGSIEYTPAMLRIIGSDKNTLAE